ncbi:MAG: tRNA pseudouridine(55) synthase TruB [Dehalococcoidia bacterium]|nr:MAG: tRNA pseudouridine(55) synthase TruB [Dehalococcoidia bacterium]
MDGILNIHKPSGPTSFSVVARVKSLTHAPKAGHGGTLDPLASGVLPVFLGQATRVAEYLMEYSKDYRAVVELGVSTESYDAEGKITHTSDTSNITLESVEASLEKFRGEILQVPPVYSALKHQGQPMYKLAREGKNVEIDSRPISIYRLDIVSFQPPCVTLDVECSKGTYIRSLAHDLGVALGCGAHLKGLIRTAYGPFDIKDAVTLEQLEELAASRRLSDALQPMDVVLSRWKKVILNEEQVTAVHCGVGLPLDIPGDTSRMRAYDKEGTFIALLVFEPLSSLWRPQKVFHQPQVAPENRPNP